MFTIKVAVINSLGAFSGDLQLNDNVGRDDVVEFVDKLEASINQVKHMVIVAEDGTDIVFTEGALQGAVIKFKIEEIDD